MIAMAEKKTLQEMRDEALPQPLSIGGKPADVCPYCGGAMFAYKTETLSTRINRYVECRNESCGKKFYSQQPIATIVREI